MRRIIITNDDGIESDGIKRLAEVAREFGEVWVIAPATQCSAMSHSITLRGNIFAKKVDFPVPDVRAYAVEGTPADCVRVGRLNLMNGNPDIVLSGINFGYNAGSDTQYSATVGAAMEASCFGVQAIALSEGINGNHEVTDYYLRDILAELIERPLKKNLIWNVNFPQCGMDRCKGIIRNAVTAPNSFFNDRYTEEILEDGTIKFALNGLENNDIENGTDFHAILNDYVSVGTINNIGQC